MLNQKSSTEPKNNTRKDLGVYGLGEWVGGVGDGVVDALRPEELHTTTTCFYVNVVSLGVNLAARLRHQRNQICQIRNSLVVVTEFTGDVAVVSGVCFIIAFVFVIVFVFQVKIVF